MTRKISSNNTILVPIDFSDIALNALDHAVVMAKKYDNKITLLHIDDETAAAETQLRDLAEKMAKAHNISISVLFKEGKISNTIAEVAEKENYDCIVMGSGGSSGIQLFMGSNASKVIRSVKLPVIVVKENKSFNGYGTIVMPVDLSVESRQKVSWAKHLAKQYNSVIHVIYEEEKDEYFQRNIKANINQVANILADNNVLYHLEKLDDKTYPGKLYEDTMQYAEKINADLVLIMTQPEGNVFDFVIGSHAQYIVNRSKTAVMVVQPSETGFSFEMN